MPFSVELGLLLALVTAVMSVLGFFLKHRGAVAAPPVELGLAFRGRSGPVLAVSAGLLWAGSDVTIKALSSKTGSLGAAVVVHPFAFVILLLSLVGLLISARSLQIGPVVPVIALTSATANALTIAAGPIVFAEPLPTGSGALLVRLAASALVICAAAMTPPPMRSAPPAASGRQRQRIPEPSARDFGTSARPGT